MAHLNQHRVCRRLRHCARGVLALVLLAGLAGVLPALAQPLPTGAPLPLAQRPFLNATEGRPTRLAGLTGATGTVLVFYCNRCHWVDRYEDRLFDLVRDYADRGVRFVLVNANDPAAFPQDAYPASRLRAQSLPVRVPYLMDDEAALAQALGAERTPHVFVFDGAARLVYSGAIDDAPSDADAVTQPYLADALHALARGRPVAVPQTKPFGCSLRCPIAANEEDPTP